MILRGNITININFTVRTHRARRRGREPEPRAGLRSVAHQRTARKPSTARRADLALDKEDAYRDVLCEWAATASFRHLECEKLPMLMKLLTLDALLL